MLAFLKRRWILLSCVGVLLVCTMVNLSYKRRVVATIFVVGYLGDEVPFPSQMTAWKLASEDGAIYFDMFPGLTVESDLPSIWSIESHRPQIGQLPRYLMSDTRSGFIIPLWLPLSAVLGWIVIRELRWREKRAKAAEAITT